VKEFKLIFWDFDGVIKESAEIKAKAFRRLFSSGGQSLANKIEAHHNSNGGMSRYEKFPIYLQWAGEEVTKGTLDALSLEFSEIVFQDILDANWVPGVLEYLQKNHQRQIFILVTATPLEEIKKILNILGISNYFKCVHGSPQTKAKAIADGLTKFKCAPDNALMIGDSYVDLSAAKENAVGFLLRRTLENQDLISRYQVKSINNFLDEMGLMNE
jgi:phosphoglycolate phosphatase-like HAD superfamily hydrolase